MTDPIERLGASAMTMAERQQILLETAKRTIVPPTATSTTASASAVTPEHIELARFKGRVLSHSSLKGTYAEAVLKNLNLSDLVAIKNAALAGFDPGGVDEQLVIATRTLDLIVNGNLSANRMRQAAEAFLRRRPLRAVRKKEATL